MKIEPKHKSKDKIQKHLNEVEVLKNQLARALADYDNLRKRVEKENEIIQKLAGLKIIARLLPIYDMLVKAQKHLKDSGLAITIGQFEDALKDEGVEKINVIVGDKFDPNLHEAVEAVNLTEDNKLKGTIAEVILDGWRVSMGPVIRHTKVKVYSDSKS
ncbi:nucleotide exchange factor GrpE [Candidatus Woesebacteria bacterium RBG_16_36_11]|uniref:Protein GrpE n=3 Tax=Candidatus Woeseibacteriota TaxID=1752722 RepID=A0A1F7XD18_9BACT|nr:MAG: nucleotide exchange factor GrpE [Candidatus Woesebacteria bacterium RBG_13_36_22]OGM12308.1 MAG: nucleotide exchange factor GrpE [Candidatus Woesebacteria bacterium RBG_16_36_11]OGM16275.1 MAG: nucleotide exchange factor GrpE [Candidatus Woesebacteria bacterium RBG_19FT_COMBO_37_29]